jgi:hypothetical protein
VSSETALYVESAVVLLVAYGTAVLRIRATGDLLDLLALVSAATGTLFALSSFRLVGHAEKLFGRDGHQALSRVLLTVLAALVAFNVVAWLRSRGRGDVAPAVPRSSRLLDHRAIVWLLVAVALVSAVVLQTGADAIIGRASDPLELKSTEQLPWWYFFAAGGLCMAQLAFLLALASALAHGGRLLSWPVLATGALALVLSATQGRLMIVNLVVPAGLLLHHHRRRFTVGMLVGVLVIGLTYFLVWDSYREEKRGQPDSGLAFSPAGVWRGITNNLDYTDSFARLVVRDPGPEYGRTYLAPATKPIPRSVWAGKPYGGNSRLTQIIFPGTLETGFSRAASAVTEAYLNFGVLGPPVVYALLALLCVALVRWWRARAAHPAATLWFAIWFLVVLIFVRTDAQIATTFLGYYAIPLWLLGLGWPRADRA